MFIQLFSEALRAQNVSEYEKNPWRVAAPNRTLSAFWVFIYFRLQTNVWKFFGIFFFLFISFFQSSRYTCVCVGVFAHTDVDEVFEYGFLLFC